MAPFAAHGKLGLTEGAIVGSGRRTARCALRHNSRMCRRPLRPPYDVNGHCTANEEDRLWTQHNAGLTIKRARRSLHPTTRPDPRRLTPRRHINAAASADSPGSPLPARASRACSFARLMGSSARTVCASQSAIWPCQPLARNACFERPSTAPLLTAGGGDTARPPPARRGSQPSPGHSTPCRATPESSCAPPDRAWPCCRPFLAGTIVTPRSTTSARNTGRRLNSILRCRSTG